MQAQPPQGPVQAQPPQVHIHPDFEDVLEGLPNQLSRAEANAIAPPSEADPWQVMPGHFSQYPDVEAGWIVDVLKVESRVPVCRVAPLDAVMAGMLVSSGLPKPMGRCAHPRQLARDPTSMRLGLKLATTMSPGGIAALQHVRRSVAHNTNTVLSPGGDTTRSMTSTVYQGVMPLPVNTESPGWPSPSPGKSNIAAQYQAGHIALVSHPKRPERIVYELLAPDEFKGDLVTYQVYHYQDDEHSPPPGHNLGVPSSWPKFSGLAIAPGMEYCYLEEQFVRLHLPRIHYHWLPPEYRHTRQDDKGRPRKVMGWVLFLEVQFWVDDGIKGSSVLEDVYVFESIGPENKLGWMAETPVGVLGAPFTQAGFVLKDRLWSDECGDLHKGVFSMQMVGAPGLVVDVGLVQVSEVKLAPTAFRCTEQGEEHFTLCVAELVAHTGIHLLVPNLSVMGAFDSFCIAVGHDGGTARDHEIPPIDKLHRPAGPCR
jgi:hypothetical protein